MRRSGQPSGAGGGTGRGGGDPFLPSSFAGTYSFGGETESGAEGGAALEESGERVGNGAVLNETATETAYESADDGGRVGRGDSMLMSDGRTHEESRAILRRRGGVGGASPSPFHSLVFGNGGSNGNGRDDLVTTETLIQEYVSACHLYGCADRINAGVLTTIRFGLPTLRASGAFHDADMLALCELLLRHGHGALSHIRRLDFSIASKEGKLHGRRGFRSHGAYALSKVLQVNSSIEEVFMQRNRVGPYGATALFLAASSNPVLRLLVMRRCRVGESGAIAFAECIGTAGCRLKEVDLSVNRIGFLGCNRIEESIAAARKRGKKIEVDLEGNLVLQEV